MNQHKLVTKSGKIITSNSNASTLKSLENTNLRFVYNSEVGAMNGYEVPE